MCSLTTVAQPIASGDEGILGNLEMLYHMPVPGLTLSTYFDADTVKTEKSQRGNITLKGWGIGLSYNKPSDWFVRLDYARCIGFANNLSKDVSSKQRVWFISGSSARLKQASLSRSLPFWLKMGRLPLFCCGRW